MIRRYNEEMLKNEESDDSPYYNDEFSFNTIDFTNTSKNLGICKIWLFGCEGIIPHFYILDKNENVICAICLKTAKYYNCDESWQFLNGDQIKLLNDVLYKQQKDQFGNIYTEWDFLCRTWDRLKNHLKFNVPKNKPNYLNLKDKKVESLNAIEKWLVNKMNYKGKNNLSNSYTQPNWISIFKLLISNGKWK